MWIWAETKLFGHEIPLEQDRPDPSSSRFDYLRYCVYGAMVCFHDGNKMSTRQQIQETFLSKIEFVRGRLGPLEKGNKMEWAYVADFHVQRDGEIRIVRRWRHHVVLEVVDLTKNCGPILVKGAGCDLAVVRRQEKASRVVHQKRGYSGGSAEPDLLWDFTEVYDLQSGMPLIQLASYSQDFISHNVWDVKSTGTLLDMEESGIKQDLAKSGSLSPAQRDAVRRKFRTGFELFQAGEFAAAELLFRDGLQVEPANEVANFYLAESLSRLNKAAEARHYWQQTIRYAPDSKEAAQARARLQNC
ncbi:MAG: hypothetical protein B0A82_06970 [Alkalinema sp. CACIAM 70d]|nr:MAG: hypothetical protein B0A82_06970 [Alkalinema sp. CACIAM 70d]